MDMKEFSERNRIRCEAPTGFQQPLESWSPSDWMVAVVGELGEACNILKKLHRIRDRVPGNAPHETEDYLKAALAKEVADTYTYLDLFAQRFGIVLEDAVDKKFNEVSMKIGYEPSDSFNSRYGFEALMAWWEEHGFTWATMPGVKGLGAAHIETHAAQAVVTILRLNGMKAWHGDGTGMLANIIRWLAEARDAHAALATKRLMEAELLAASEQRLCEENTLLRNKLDVMQDALEKAAVQFESYRDLHRQKNTKEGDAKAEVNGEFAAMLRLVIADPLGVADTPSSTDSFADLLDSLGDSEKGG